MRPLRHRLYAALFCLTLAGASGAAPEPQAAPEYSEFERLVIADVLGSRSAEIDPEPEGKRIEAIEIVRFDVFDERDPVPDFLNLLHVTSRDYVIARELLFERGSSYRSAEVDETARNLRELRQLSLVLIVPARGSQPDRVRVFVITKDVWSLRLNSAFEVEGNGYLELPVMTGAGLALRSRMEFEGTHLNYLLLNPSEENLFGTHTSIGGLFILEPDAYSTGVLFRNPRVAGSRIQARLNVNVIFNRDTSEAEGSFGSFLYGQPLYSAETEWSWQSAALWRTEVTRLFRGGELRTYDARATPGADDIPYIYDSDAALGVFDLTRSFGRVYKHDVSVGLEADRKSFRPRGLGRFDPRAVEEFVRSEVPVSDTRMGPFLQVRSYTSNHVRMLDMNTLALQEDFRLGHETMARVYPASSELGSTRDMLGSYAGISYTAVLGDALVRALASSTTEVANRGRHDALLELRARVASPRIGIGRLVYDALLLNRHQNYLNRSFVLGGDNRLRGYPSNDFRGKDVFVHNLEFRSTSLEILSAHVGFALFYDSGDAADGFRRLTLEHGAGLGLRFLFPQAARIVLRADWGLPIANDRYASFPGALFVTFGQAFPMPSLVPPSLLGLFEQ